MPKKNTPTKAVKSPSRTKKLITIFRGLLDFSTKKNNQENQANTVEFPVKEKSSEISENRTLRIKQQHIFFRNNLKRNKTIYGAIEDGNIGEVIHFLEQGVDVNCLNKRNLTPLQVAAINSGYAGVEYLELIKIIEILLEHGADANKYKSFEKDSPLSFAARHNSPSAVKLLLSCTEKKDFTVRVPYTGELIQYPWYTKMLDDACHYSNKIAIWDQLLQHGADFNVTMYNQYTLLTREAISFYCAIYGSVNKMNKRIETIKYLLENGADPSVISINHAFTNRDAAGSTLHAFLDEIPDLDRLENKEEIIEKIKEIINLLIEYGADINAVDDKGNTPLHYLAESGNPTMLALLIDLGANVSIVNNEKLTPLQVARQALPALKRKYELSKESEQRYAINFSEVEMILAKNVELKKNEQLTSLQNTCLFYFYKNPKGKEVALNTLEQMHFTEMAERLASYYPK